MLKLQSCTEIAFVCTYHKVLTSSTLRCSSSNLISYRAPSETRNVLITVIQKRTCAEKPLRKRNSRQQTMNVNHYLKAVDGS